METHNRAEIRALRFARADAHAAASKARVAVTRAYNAMREAEIAAEAAIKAALAAKMDTGRIAILRGDLLECALFTDELKSVEERWTNDETEAMRLFNELPMDGI